eukprot:jgi/Astpho2/5963/e_gw1.00080.8.1_t
MSEVSSSIYATPLITDLYSDGHKDIIVPSFVHYLDVLEGSSGAKAADWEAFHRSMVHASPFLFDLDSDGIQDILLATYDGAILSFKDDGERLSSHMQVPRLKVRRDWFKGLRDDPIDHSHPDVGTQPDAETGDVPCAMPLLQTVPCRALQHTGSAAGQQHPHSLSGAQQQEQEQQPEQLEDLEVAAREQLSMGPHPPAHRQRLQRSDAMKTQRADAGSSRRRLMVADEGAGFYTPPAPGTASLGGCAISASAGTALGYRAMEQQLSDEAVQSANDLFGADGFDEDVDLDTLQQNTRPGREGGSRQAQDSVLDHVWVDPHILCTPAIADMDGDGVEEMVVAVSYYFDRAYYDSEEHQHELRGTDLGQYIASGVVIFDLHSQTVKGAQHLDLTSDRTQYRAYAYSAPTLVDLDRDGRLEIVLGTSMGFLYVLDCQGNPREGWPLQMGDIQGQVAVSDVNGDGALELVAADLRGNVVAFTIDGTEIWERHVASQVTQGVTLGDVNGDGRLEVVFGTTSGQIFVLDGHTGKNIPNFPFQTLGRIAAPVLVTQLTPGLSQQLVVMSFDGHLYMVDGLTGCADSIDIGENSYAMVLADDLDNNGHMELVAATMNGNVYAFQTAAEYHPLKSWTSAVHGLNALAARFNWQGIAATAATRAPRDVRGRSLNVRFEITDKRSGTVAGPGVSTQHLLDGDTPVIGTSENFTKPGIYTLEVPCPKTRSTATIHLEMWDENKITFVDDFSLSFHMHFEKLLKWLVALPFTLAAIVLIGLKGNSATHALPSFSRTDGLLAEP